MALTATSPVFFAKKANAAALAASTAAALAASTAAESGLLGCSSLVKSICVGCAPDVVCTSTIGSCGRCDTFTWRCVVLPEAFL